MKEMQFVMKGRIEKVVFNNNNHYSRLISPAPDTYSQPSGFKVKSLESIGQVGEEVNLLVTVSGYVKEKPYKDKITGEPKIYEEQVVYFLAVRSPNK